MHWPFKRSPDLEEPRLDAELRFHFDALVAQNVQAGMSDSEARRRARIEFGGIEQVKEECRDAWGRRWFEDLFRNLRLITRSLRTSPGFAITAVGTLALGIGANTAIFTVDYNTLIAPAPYPDSDQLVMVWSKLQGHRNLVSAGDFMEWKQRSTSFQDLNAFYGGDFNVLAGDKLEFVQGMRSTPGYNGMLGSPMFLGRTFLPQESEPGKEHVVILTHRLWQTLGGNRKLLGQNLIINGEPYNVVGVMAPGVADRKEQSLILPMVLRPDQLNHDFRGLLVAGRLKSGVSIRQAQAGMDVMAAQLAEQYPKSNRGWGAIVEPLKNDFLPSARQRALWLLLGAAGFLFLMACVNVANLSLARGMIRQREVAIRSALGAGRASLFAQVLTENLVLAIAGGVLGVALGYAILRELVTWMPPHLLPPEADLRLNVPVLLAMLAAATLAGALAGGAPAWYASRLDPDKLLKEGARAGTGLSRLRLRRILITGEFALSVALLAGAGLSLHSLWNLLHVDLGLRTEHTLTFYLVPPSVLKDPKQTNPYYRRMLASIETVPGVSRAAAMSYVPLDDLHSETNFGIAGDPAYADPSQRPNADRAMVTPGYFRTFGIQIVRGRAFTDADDSSSFKVAMVNEVFVDRYLKGLDPLRRSLVMQTQVPGEPKLGPAVEWRIVGVFHTVKSRGSRADNPEIDVPFWQEAFPIAGIGVRTGADPATMLSAVRAAVNAVDPQTALALPRTMDRVREEVLVGDKFAAILFAGFAGIALMLAAVGIYGVMASSVAQRSSEIAVRMALGSKPSDVRRLVVSQGVRLTLLGTVIGVGAAFGLTRLLASLLYGVQPRDPMTFIAVPVVLIAVAFVACWIPARRATRINPSEALRCE